jgi:YgiT-type zinc finger domain-containing protein
MPRRATACSCEYQRRKVTHTVRHQGKLVVIDHVPAEVCTVCGDVLLAPRTIRHIERLLESRREPAGTLPLYEYA